MQNVRILQLGAAFVAVAVLGVAAMKWARPAPDPKDQFREAVVVLGITNDKHRQLRSEFEFASLEMERNPCNDSLRQIAGQTAVAYYETLLERPFVKAKLEMTQRNLCSGKIDGKWVPAEPLTLIQAFHNGLRLPWECLPADWRTPTDLALQAKLEADIRGWRLTSDALTGTLGLLAKPWDNSPHARACEAPPSQVDRSPRTQLPLVSAPPDSWSNGRRR
jgi:hypothetical protein